MLENPLVLTFDIGTQSARVMLVDRRGNVVAKEQESYERPYFSPQPGWAEQDPGMYWQTMCRLSLRLREKTGEAWGRVIAVTCTCIRATAICLDKERRPLRSAIVWLDKRVARDLPPLSKKSWAAFKLAGVLTTVITVRNNLACNWIHQHEPEIWAKTDKFVLLSAYLYYLFTGNLVECKANIAGIVPFDYKTRNWLSPNDVRRGIYLVEDEKLPGLLEPGAEVGRVTAEAARLTGIGEGLPLIASGADKACETLGLSCLDESSAALGFGTIATVEVATSRYFGPSNIMPPYLSVAGGYLPEMETYRGYWLISWFKREFAAKEMAEAELLGCSAEDLLNARLKEIPAGCDGLILQPTFTPNARTPHAKGAIVGFSDVHTRIHIYRAIIEGINFSLMEGLNLLEQKGNFKIRRLFVAGGGSRSSEICQITANMFGLPVYRTQTHEVCGVGSSIPAFITMGLYRDYNEAVREMVHVKEEFLPDAGEHAVYQRLFKEVYCRLFESLVPTYANINSILRHEPEPDELYDS